MLNDFFLVFFLFPFLSSPKRELMDCPEIRASVPSLDSTVLFMLTCAQLDNVIKVPRIRKQGEFVSSTVQKATALLTAAPPTRTHADSASNTVRKPTVPLTSVPVPQMDEGSVPGTV